jgi:hypothetical protein
MSSRASIHLVLMDQISRRVVLNMEQRKKDFEAATKVLIPTKDALSIISTRGHIYERNIAYTKGTFNCSLMVNFNDRFSWI